jgi:hypothetical protein
MGVWAARLSAALAGTVLYYYDLRLDWSNPLLALYDAPTLCIAFGFGGSALYRLGTGARREGGVKLAALLLAVFFASGAEYRSWPLSGHLTVAVSVGVQEAADRQNPLWLRGAVLLPILLLVAIRTFWPQMPQMDSPFNTVAGLLVGGLIGGGALSVWLRRSDPQR